MTLEKAKEILGSDIKEYDTIYCGLPWVLWRKGQSEISLDGDFTLEYLQALVIWMEHVQEKQ